MSKIVTAGVSAFCAGILCAAPVSLRISPVGSMSLSLDRAVAVIGRPLTPLGGYGYGTYYGGYPPYGYGWTYQPCEYGTYQTGNGYGYGMYAPYRSYGYNAYRPYRLYGYYPHYRRAYRY
jgi:hypothetical protein